MSKERVYIISFGPIDIKIYSWTQYKIRLNRCDWHILAGNTGKIVVHCWFVKDAKHTYVTAANIRCIFHTKKPESSLTRKRMHRETQVERMSSWLKSVRSLSTGNEPGCSAAQWEDQSGVTCREVGNHGDSHESSEFIQCRVEQDVWCLQPGWVQFSTFKSHTRSPLPDPPDILADIWRDGYVL